MEIELRAQEQRLDIPRRERQCAIEIAERLLPPLPSLMLFPRLTIAQAGFGAGEIVIGLVGIEPDRRVEVGKRPGRLPARQRGAAAQGIIGGGLRRAGRVGAAGGGLVAAGRGVGQREDAAAIIGEIELPLTVRDEQAMGEEEIHSQQHLRRAGGAADIAVHHLHLRVLDGFGADRISGDARRPRAV